MNRVEISPKQNQIGAFQRLTDKKFSKLQDSLKNVCNNHVNLNNIKAGSINISDIDQTNECMPIKSHFKKEETTKLLHRYCMNAITENNFKTYVKEVLIPKQEELSPLHAYQTSTEVAANTDRLSRVENDLQMIKNQLKLN